MINLTINGIKTQANPGDTILKTALDAGIYIPTLCHEARFPPHGGCGLCVVEIAGLTKPVRACATHVSEGMAVQTASPRIKNIRKHLLELQFSEHAGDCKAPCQLACPAQTNCQGYISLILDGRIQEGYQLAMEAHPFPGSIARVCPRPCESKCRRGLKDTPINIAGLKRFIADASKSYVPTIANSTGKSVAIVGGGPAGLTAAYFLRRAGHNVAVYERMPKMGGLLRYGIPEYRLPKAVLDAEIDVLAHMGIRLCNNTILGNDINLDELHSEHDAVIIATGAGLSRKAGIPGEDLPFVIGGIDFLRDVDTCDSLGGKSVVVFGGSNTAIDAARTALRLGAKSVVVAYRRTKDEMPAEPEEIADAEEEGVLFKFLVAPLEIVQDFGFDDNDKSDMPVYSGVKLQKMTLGEPDASGRRSPVSIPGQEELLPADIVITAIGQAVALGGLESITTTRGALDADKNCFGTNLAGVYAIGDATGQSAYAIEAISHGRKAAAAIHESLVGTCAPWAMLPKLLSSEEKTPSDFADIPTAPRAKNPKKEAPKGFDEVHMSLSNEDAMLEARRCLSCGCGGYDKCKLVSYANDYNATPDKYKKSNPTLAKATPIYDPKKCIHCGLCVKACAEDRGILTMAYRGINVTVYAHPIGNCAKCGNCAKICTVGARAHVLHNVIL